MNSAAVKIPSLVGDGAREFGFERITAAVDARKNKAMPSGFELVVSGGTKPVGWDAIAWARECQDLGAGVILPTSMDGVTAPLKTMTLSSQRPLQMQSQ